MNRATNSKLNLIHAFVIVLGSILLISAIIGIGQTIQNPKKITIPVRLNTELKEPGYINYEENNSPIAIDFSQLEANVVYKEKKPSNAPINWADIIYILLRVTLMLWIVFLTHKFMQTTLKKGPFCVINADRMRKIGYSLIFLGILRFFIGVWDLSIVEEHLISQYVDIENCYSAASMGELTGKLLLTEMPIGLFALFIAAIFKHGIELRKENELTI